MSKLLIVDGNNIIYKSYYGTSRNGEIMMNSQGMPTNAVFGFARFLERILKEDHTHIVVCFDAGKKTFRNDDYSEYKANRSSAPDSLSMQFSLVHELVEAYGIKTLKLVGYEADDLIGTILVENYFDVDEFEIITGDKDLFQLVNPKTVVRYTGKSMVNMDYIDPMVVKERYGFDRPGLIQDLKGLMGDASDNIPGVKGIGGKTALKLLNEYGDLDGVYDNLDKLSKGVRTKLTEGKESAYMSKQLATIYLSVPIDTNMEQFKRQRVTRDVLIPLFERLNFNTLLKKYKK